ncbi:YbaB/EbfC family nucleoid-associated protein [Candidatus Gracilibacteria bacterium]|jgi:DNA-binding protein YbaB|nr:YbaB/EbfC family nucleoid-associated protein [Candidatus Gracilibacteria bacterium]
MSFLDKAKQLYDMQKQAKAIKEKLAKTHIEAELNGIKITISGEQKVIKVEIMDESLLSDKAKLEKSLLEAFNKAVEKAQEVAAANMKDIMGSLGLGA